MVSLEDALGTPSSKPFVAALNRWMPGGTRLEGYYWSREPPMKRQGRVKVWSACSQCPEGRGLAGCSGEGKRDGWVV